MGLESATFLSGLVATNPIGATDPKSQGDDHLRLIKSVLLATFPNLNAAVNATPAQLNLLVGLTLVAQPTFLFKAADTDRVSTTVFADDPDLTTTLQPGTYEIDLTTFWQDVTTNTQQIKAGLRFGGTATIFAGHYEASPNGGLTSEVYVDQTGGNAMAGTAYPAGPANSTSIIKIRAMIVVTVAGTLAFQWAQFNTSVNATRVQKWSFLRIQRMV